MGQDQPQLESWLRPSPKKIGSRLASKETGPRPNPRETGSKTAPKQKGGWKRLDP